jgi:hypothetical protein
MEAGVVQDRQWGLSFEVSLTSEKEYLKERARIESTIENSSRLFVVDVGKESESLRLRYPDRSRYIITPALVGIHVEPLSLEPDKKRQSRIQGYVRELLIDHIHVPLSKKGSLESVLKDEANNAGRDGRPH